MNATGKIRVLIADDHAVLRTGLRMLIRAQRDMTVTAEVASGEEAVRRARGSKPDVVLMDLSMPSGGAAAIEKVLRACPTARVLVLTMHDDPAYARSAIAAGAAGYVVKRAAGSELLTAIRSVHQGRTFVDVDLKSVSVPRILGKKARGSPLSRREHQVLDLVARGHTNRTIAEQIGAGVKSVETYRSRIAEKLGLLTRADIVAYALETGLLGKS